MRECRAKNKVLNTEEKHQTLPLSRLYAEDRIVEADKDEDPAQNLIGYLNQNRRCYKSEPGIHLRWSFAGLVQCSLDDKHRHDLLDEDCEYGLQ